MYGSLWEGEIEKILWVDRECVDLGTDRITCGWIYRRRGYWEKSLEFRGTARQCGNLL